MSRRAGAARGGGPCGIFTIGKSRARLFNKDTDAHVKFKDVASMVEAKEEITESIKFLKEPHTYEKLGAKIPRSTILPVLWVQAGLTTPVENVCIAKDSFPDAVSAPPVEPSMIVTFGKHGAAAERVTKASDGIV